MNWKNRLTNYNFWISIVSAVLLILQAFEFQFDIMYINEIATAVLGLLVVIGIINDPTKSATKKENTTQTSDKENSTQSEDEITKVDNAQNKKNECVVKEEINSATEKEDKEISFPIDEENEINVNNNEDDIKNLIATISNDMASEKIQVEQILEKFLNLLKNNEKITNISQNLENLLQDEEKVVTEIEEKHIETDNLDEIVETNLKETVEEKFKSLDIAKNENIDKIQEGKDIQIENETKREIQQASSFNIVN